MATTIHVESGEPTERDYAEALYHEKPSCWPSDLQVTWDEVENANLAYEGYVDLFEAVGGEVLTRDDGTAILFFPTETI